MLFCRSLRTNAKLYWLYERRALFLVCILGTAPVTAAAIQAPRTRSAHDARYVRALLLSDIHFDPFQDPAKVSRLAESPVNAWTGILGEPPSPDQSAAYERVRNKCGVDVFETSPALLTSTVSAVRSKRQTIAFSVLTGDLVAHDFFCRFEATLPDRPHEQAKAFLAKTIEYVIDSLSRAMGSKPLYVALGNNDSTCGDYRLDENDKLFHDLLPAVAHAARTSVSALSAEGYESRGSFDLPMPWPLNATRILILNDLPFSTRFQSCSGAKSSNLADEDLLWLKDHFRLAREQQKKVWFAAHIPTGIDPRPTLFGSDVCTSRQPTMFLSSDALGSTLADFADVVKLALFAHTHMDEIRIVRNDSADKSMYAEGVPTKLIPSISPVSGNRPSFLIAKIDVKTSLMSDYTKYEAPRAGDANTSWIAKYSFQKTYAEPSYSVPAIEDLLSRFQTDSPLNRLDVAQYIDRYSSGAPKYGIAPVWNSYRCIFKSLTAEQFLGCACPAGKPSVE